MVRLTAFVFLLMNTYEITYSGNLRTSALHVDSAEMIQTDAPKDNEGLGESFSLLICFVLLWEVAF